MFALVRLWRVSPQMIAAYAVVSMVGGFIALDPDRSGWLSVLVSSSAATVAAIALLLTGIVLVRVLRGSWRVGLWFLPIAVIVGVARAWVLAIVAEASGSPVGGGAGGIAASSAFSAVIWLSLVGLLVAGQDAYRERYRSLVRGTAGRDDIEDLDAHPSVTRMRTSLSAALEAAAAEPTPQQWAQASSAIRHEIDTTLRPLSHRLWFGGADEEPHARWPRVVRDAIAGFRVPVLAAAALWLVGSLIGGAALLGWRAGWLAAVVSTVVLVAALGIARRLLAGRESLAWGSLAVAVVSALPIVLTDAGMRAVGITAAQPGQRTVGPLLWLTLAGLLVLVCSVSLAASDRREVLAVAARGSRETRVSSYLHNGLQSELTGMAMQLEGAARADDPDVARDALERVQSLLSRSLSEDLAAFHEEPIARADRVAQAWAGICAVTFTLPAGVRSDPLLPEAVTAAEELIANAVRHTGATRIEVRVDDCAPGGLLVVCRSDTPGGAASGSGLGSHLLASVSEIAPEVLPDEQGTTYSVRIGASRRA